MKTAETGAALALVVAVAFWPVPRGLRECAGLAAAGVLGLVLAALRLPTSTKEPM